MNTSVILLGFAAVIAYLLFTWVLLPLGLLWAVSVFVPSVQVTVVNTIAVSVILWVIRVLFNQVKGD